MNSIRAKGRHSPEHMAKMSQSGTPVRVFTETEREWLTVEWPHQSLEALARQLKCRTAVLKREAHHMGLPARKAGRRPVKASELRVKRTYHKGCERVADVDGEKASPPPEGILYACPGCGMRALSPLGHAGCITRTQEAA